MVDQWDVIVIGGGPAGSTAATQLARMGWRVVLFEKEHFPREHIGESLLPASLPILEEIGALPAVEAAGFLKKYGATMVWGSGQEPWSWHFRETNRTHPHAYQVWRPQFDQILLQNAVRHGVEAREGVRVTEVALNGQERMEVRIAGPGGAAETVRARHVVDASGQAGLIGRMLSLRKPDDQFQNLAAYAYFEGCERLPAPDENNIFIESYEHGWFWMIPLHTGLMSVGAVVDHRYGSAQIRAHGLEAHLNLQIAAAPNAARMLRAANRRLGPFVIRDWSYASDEITGDGWVLAGDAACFIDPLFSTGVHLALSAGMMAGAYVTTALKDPALAREAAPVYKELYYGQYNLFRQLARLFYSTNRTVDSYFWEARRILGSDDSLEPRSAFIRAVAGQTPKGYERAVIERGEVPDELRSGVRELSAERAERRRRVDAAMAASGRAGIALLDAVPERDPRASVRVQPVLGPGEFVPGHVLVTDDHPEGSPVSAFVARLIDLADSRRDVRAMVEALAAETGRSPAALTGQVITAVGILYVDGAIRDLRGM